MPHLNLTLTAIVSYQTVNETNKYLRNICNSTTVVVIVEYRDMLYWKNCTEVTETMNRLGKDSLKWSCKA